MALTKPILNTVPAWDVVDGQTFTFNVIGGDVVVSNTLYIKDNSTNTIVYTLTTVSYKYECEVPANASGLENGKYYSAYIITHDSSNNDSPPSNTIQFYCYITPSWTLNINSQTTIVNSYFNAIVTYNQPQGELLNDYTISLYDSSENLAMSSGMLYVNSTEFPLSLEYMFQGLEDNTRYFLRAIGHTVNSTFLDTGLIDFIVEYSEPSEYNILLLQNNCEDGYITYYSAAESITGISNPPTPTYTVNGINLLFDDSYVKYENIKVSEDFYIQAWIEQPKLNTTLIILETISNEFIIIDCIQDWEDNNKIRIQATVNNNYYIYSNNVTYNNANVYSFRFLKNKNLYDLVLEEV